MEAMSGGCGKCIDISVVSMELLSPHKMAEIIPRQSNEGVPYPNKSISTNLFAHSSRDLTRPETMGVGLIWTVGSIRLKVLTLGSGSVTLEYQVKSDEFLNMFKLSRLKRKSNVFRLLLPESLGYNNISYII